MRAQNGLHFALELTPPAALVQLMKTLAETDCAEALALDFKSVEVA
ncbi:MAG: hypothetical protein V2I51_05485 [Anderseniella sp.]|jgi:hypothetical protein|nr:hypothetical protein [Anderseniella sp.]